MFESMLELLHSSSSVFTELSQEEIAKHEWTTSSDGHTDEDAKPNVYTPKPCTKRQKIQPYENLYVPPNVHDFFEVVFEQTPTLAPAQASLLGRYFQLPKKKVQTWFSNRRRHVLMKEQERIRGRKLRSLRPNRHHTKQEGCLTSGSDWSGLSLNEDIGYNHRVAVPFARSFSAHSALMKDWTSDYSSHEHIFEAEALTPAFISDSANMPTVSYADYNMNRPVTRPENAIGVANCYASENGSNYLFGQHADADAAGNFSGGVNDNCHQQREHIENTRAGVQRNNYSIENGNYNIAQSENLIEQHAKRDSARNYFTSENGKDHQRHSENTISQHPDVPGSFTDEQGSFYSSENGNYHKRVGQTGTLHWEVGPKPRYERYTRVVLSSTWDPITRILNQPESKFLHGVDFSAMYGPNLSSNEQLCADFEQAIGYENGEVYVPDMIDPATGTNQLFFSPPSCTSVRTHFNLHGQKSSNLGNCSTDCYVNTWDADAANKAVPSLMYYEDARGQVSSLSEILDIQPELGLHDDPSQQPHPNVTEPKTMQHDGFQALPEVMSHRLDYQNCYQRPIGPGVPAVGVEPFRTVAVPSDYRHDQPLPTYGGDLFDDLSVFPDNRADISFRNTDDFDTEESNGDDSHGSSVSEWSSGDKPVASGHDQNVWFNPTEAYWS